MLPYEKGSLFMRFKIKLSKTQRDFLIMILIILLSTLCAVFNFSIKKSVFAEETNGATNVWSGEIAESFAGGTGDESDPYLIETGEQLAKLANDVNNGETYSGKYFKLTSNIALNAESPINDNFTAKSTTILNGLHQWTPIGTSTSQFAGTFDGNNRKITNMYIYDVDKVGYRGLFSYADGATFLNLGIEGFYIRSANGYTGGLLGAGNNVTINNCYSSGRISNGTTPKMMAILVGYLDGANLIENCHSSGLINYGTNYIAGIVGYVHYDFSDSVKIVNCYNDATIEGNSDLGGIVGYGRAEISNCYNLGSIGKTVYKHLGTDRGGIVGNAAGTVITIKNCYNSGSVTGNGNVGGIAGSSYANIEDCYNTGDIFVGTKSSSTAETTHYLGGIVGYAGIAQKIANCYNTGTINAEFTPVEGRVVTTYAGGITGRKGHATEFFNCYNTGKVTGQFAGGIAGMISRYESSASSKTMYDCYNTGEVKATTGEAAGIGVLNVNAYHTSSQTVYIYNCYNTGNVTGVTGAAGIIYNAVSLVQNCYNTGSISVTGEGSAALIGRAASGYTLSFKNCYSLAQDGKELINKDDATSVTETNVTTLTQGQLSGNDAVDLTVNGKKYASIIEALNAGKYSTSHNNWGIIEGCNDNYPMFSNNTGALSDTIYFSASTGSDDNYGLTKETGVKTFDRAAALVKDGGTIYITEEVTIEDSQIWTLVNKPNVVVKKDASGPENIIVIKSGGNLTINNVTLDGGVVWEGDIDPVLGRGTTNNGLKKSTRIVYVKSSGSLTINDSTVQNSQHGGFGAFVYSLTGSNCTFKNVIFKDSKVSMGSALQLYGNATFTNCKIYGCYGPYSGIGHHKTEDPIKLISCEIRNNKAGNSCGAVYLSDCEADIENCIISKNDPYGNVGGLQAENMKRITIDQCTITDNTKTDNNAVDLRVYASTNASSETVTLKNSTIGSMYGKDSLYLDGVLNIQSFSNSIADYKLYLKDGFIGYKEDGTGSNIKINTSGVSATVANPVDAVIKPNGSTSKITATQRLAFSSSDNNFRLARNSDKTKILIYPTPSYNVTIPEKHDITSKIGEFSIEAVLNNFIGNDKLKVTLENTEFVLSGSTNGNKEVIKYILNGHSSIIFSSNGNNKAVINYELATVEPLYSDTYSQNLTFKITYEDGDLSD